jgi:hypothetical protein
VSAADASIWVTAAATIATAVATGVLAVVTWLLWKSTQRMAAATGAPNVVATVEPNRWSYVHMDLVVENCGTGPAFDIQIAFDPPLVRDAKEGIVKPEKQSNAPLNAISVLRPSQSMRDAVGRTNRLVNGSHTVTVSCKASPKAKERLVTSYILDLRHLRGVVRLGGGDPLVQIAQEARKLRESVDKIVGGPNRLGVDVYTEHDRAEEADEQERAFDRMSAMLEQHSAAVAASPPAAPLAKKPRKPRAAS